MRRFSLLQFFFAFLLLCGCGDKGFGSFTFTETSQEATVQGGGLGTLLPVDNLLPPLRLTIDLEEELESRDASGADGVYLTGLAMEITDTAMADGDVDDFDFIDEVNVFVESTSQGSSLDSIQIATLRDVPSDAMRVEFDVDDSIDLKPYIEEGIRLTTKGSAEVPEDDTSLQALVTLTVDVL